MNRVRFRSRLRGLPALLAWCAALALPAQGVAAVTASACAMESTSAPATSAGMTASAHSGHATGATSRVVHPDRTPGPGDDCGSPCTDHEPGSPTTPGHSGHGCQMTHCAGAVALVEASSPPTVPENASRETAHVPTPLYGDSLAEPSPPPRA